MLPFPMDAIGVPGCHLNTDILLVALAASNALGEARRSGAIPRDAGFLGFGFRFQALVLDMQANALGLAMSNGSKTRVCGPDPVVRVVATGITQATGQVEVGVSPVTRFSLK
ncbi:MAG: hypothetical protein QGG14_03235 [Planctomycetota bacterium]|nr:hypothetical protein [Planctomycetota bacterium]